MISKILPLLKQSIPLATAMQGIAAADPRLKAFIFAASAAGYGADKVMDFLRSIGETKGQKQFDARTKQRQEQGVARPDEQAGLAATEQVEGVQKAVKTGAALAGGLAAARAAGPAAGAAAGQASNAVIPEVLAAEQAVAPQAQIGMRQKLLQGGQQGQQQQIGNIAPQAPQQAIPQASPQAAPQQAIQQAAPAAAVAAKAVSPKNLSYFNRAMEGIQYSDLSDDIKPSVGKIAKRLDRLEHDGISYKDKPVQKLVKGLQKMVKGTGLVNEESARFAAQYPQQQQAPQQPQQPQQQAPQQTQQQQGPSSDDEFLKLLDEFSTRFMG